MRRVHEPFWLRCVFSSNSVCVPTLLLKPNETSDAMRIFNVLLDARSIPFIYRYYASYRVYYCVSLKYALVERSPLQHVPATS